MDLVSHPSDFVAAEAEAGDRDSAMSHRCQAAARSRICAVERHHGQTTLKVTAAGLPPSEIAPSALAQLSSDELHALLVEAIAKL
jgi:hypothetical protein